MPTNAYLQEFLNSLKGLVDEQVLKKIHNSLNKKSLESLTPREVFESWKRINSLYRGDKDNKAFLDIAMYINEEMKKRGLKINPSKLSKRIDDYKKECPENIKKEFIKEDMHWHELENGIITTPGIEKGDGHIHAVNGKFTSKNEGEGPSHTHTFEGKKTSQSIFKTTKELHLYEDSYDDIDGLIHASNQYDSVLASSVMLNISNKDLFMKEVHRCLKPKGKFLFKIFKSEDKTNWSKQGLKLYLNEHLWTGCHKFKEEYLFEDDSFIQGLYVKPLSNYEEIKKEENIKAIVLDRRDNKDNEFNYLIGLVNSSGIKNNVNYKGTNYVDLGWTFNTKLKADFGDIVSVDVLKLLHNKEDNTLKVLGARIKDIDKERKQPFNTDQLIKLAVETKQKLKKEFINKSDNEERVNIFKIDNEKKIVYGVVLEPWTDVTPKGDAHGMTSIL